MHFYLLWTAVMSTSWVTPAQLLLLGRPPHQTRHVSLFPFGVRGKKKKKKRFRVLAFDYAVVTRQFGGTFSREPAEVPLEAERCCEGAELPAILTGEVGSVLAERSPRASRMLTKC